MGVASIVVSGLVGEGLVRSLGELSRVRLSGGAVM